MLVIFVQLQRSDAVHPSDIDVARGYTSIWHKRNYDTMDSNIILITSLSRTIYLNLSYIFNSLLYSIMRYIDNAKYMKHSKVIIKSIKCQITS